MLNALFKPAWQSKSVDKRLQFINNMTETSAENIEVLKTLVNTDDELSIREAALDKITDPIIVYDFIKKHSDGATRDKAVSVFSHLTGPKSKLTEQDFRILLKKHSETTLSIAKSCPYNNLRLELIGKLSLTEQVDLLTDVEYSDTRVYIAEKLSSENLLEKARKNLKGKDKNAEKIIKTKLHEIHAKQKKDEENLEKAETLCDKMEYLAAHDGWRSEFNDRYEQCNRQWKSLDFTPSDYLLQRYKAANNKVSLIIKEQENIATALNKQTNSINELNLQSEEISKLPIEELLKEHGSLRSSFSKNNATWKESLEIIKPEKSIWKKYESLSRSLDSVLNYAIALKPIRIEYLSQNETSDVKIIDALNKKSNALLANLEWSKDLPKLICKEQAVTELSELKNIGNKLKNDASEQLDKLHKRINRLQGSTKRGNLEQARRELAAVIKLTEKYTTKDKEALDERLEKATIAVDKMADWKDYVTAPKFIELCEAMEALSPDALKAANKASMHADKLASKIVDLQKNWKALGNSVSADENWERFKKAGDLAYAPCDEFFKQRRDTRSKNLTSREPFVKQMQDLASQTNWQDNNECKQTLISVRKIDEAWKKIKDVEPGPGTKQWKRLRKAKTTVYAKLDDVYASNLTLKKELITKSKELLETEIQEESLKNLQTLQSQWKEIGITKRKDDQKAWEAFKLGADAVFEKIQGSRKAKRAAEDEQLKPYRDVIKSIQHLSKTAKTLADADSNFEKYQTEHAALPPMPRGIPERIIEAIQKDYQYACKDFDRTRERILSKKKHQALDNLATKSALCCEYEALPVDASEIEIDDLKTQMDALVISDNELNKRFIRRLKLARETDRANYTETRKLMCIDLEILLGIDSPTEDKSQRMQIQLERMQKGGFGQERVEKDAVLKKMKLDWYCLPGAEPEIQKTLDKRFKKLIQ